jgi:hypothetical protein
MCILKDNTAWRMLYGAPAFQGVLVAFEAWWFMLTLWAAFHFTRVVQASVLKRRSANAVIKLTYGCMCPACALRVVYYGSLLVAVFRGRDVFCDTKRFPSVLIIRDLFYALLLIVFSGLAIFWFALGTHCNCIHRYWCLYIAPPMYLRSHTQISTCFAWRLCTQTKLRACLIINSCVLQQTT